MEDTLEGQTCTHTRHKCRSTSWEPSSGYRFASVHNIFVDPVKTTIPVCTWLNQNTHTLVDWLWIIWIIWIRKYWWTLTDCYAGVYVWEYKHYLRTCGGGEYIRPSTEMKLMKNCKIRNTNNVKEKPYMALQHMFVEKWNSTLLAGNPRPDGCLLVCFLWRVNLVIVQAGTDSTNNAFYNMKQWKEHWHEIFSVVICIYKQKNMDPQRDNDND
jgi:hypothetical protein